MNTAVAVICKTGTLAKGSVNGVNTAVAVIGKTGTLAKGVCQWREHSCSSDR